MTEHSAGNSIVVGIDGSEASRAALRWATRQAHKLHADVIAVHAWEPVGQGFAPYAPASVRPSVSEQRVRDAQLLASTVREVFGPRIDDAVRAVVVEGAPARVLTQQASGALLLALGRTAPAEHGLPVMGAVGRACLRQSTVPVVTVPATDRPAPAVRTAETASCATSGTS